MLTLLLIISRKFSAKCDSERILQIGQIGQFLAIFDRHHGPVVDPGGSSTAQHHRS